MIPWLMIGRNAVGVMLGVRKRRAKLRRAGVEADPLILTAQEVGKRAGEVSRNLREKTAELAEASSEKFEEMRDPAVEAAKRGFREAEKVAHDPSEFSGKVEQAVNEGGKRVDEVLNVSNEEWAERGERAVRLARDQKRRIEGAFRTLRRSFRTATGKSGSKLVE